MLSNWIISHFHDHRIYVEPFGGGGSVLLKKPRAYAEVYNDIDGDTVNVFRMVRDRGPELQRLLELTPYAREEMVFAFEKTDDPLERARRAIVRSFLGFGSGSITADKASDVGFRSNSMRSGSTPAADWSRYPAHLHLFTERLQGVVIENRDALKVMSAHDTPETLHYVDPPYIFSTRHKGDKSKEYRYEMDNPKHLILLEFLKTLKGTVILSGYDNELYNTRLDGWFTSTKETFADGAKPRTEKLWIKYYFD